MAQVRPHDVTTYAQLTGLLKSDMATIEIELNVALRALGRKDTAQARIAIADARLREVEGQYREVRNPNDTLHANETLRLLRTNR